MISNEDLSKIAKARYKKARNFTSEWKEEANECRDYKAGRQWDEKDVTKLEGQGKAPIVMNRIKPRVAAVVGMEIANRQELRFQPRETVDSPIVALINDASEWTRDQSMAEDHETEAFEDVVVTGMGWTETIMDYDENLDGIAAVRRRDCIGFDWDPDSTERNLADRKYHFFSQDMDISAAEAMFPDFDGKFSKSALGVGDLWESGDGPHNADDAKFYPNQVPADEEKDSKTARIVKYEYYEMEPAWRIVRPSTGELTIVTPDEADEMKSDAKEQGKVIDFTKIKSGQDVRLIFTTEDGVIHIPYVEQKQKRFYRAFFTGDEVIEHEESPCPYGFTDQCMTWERDAVKNYWFGMVRGLRDPQSLINKFMSQAIYIYTVNPKGGAYVEKQWVENPQDFEDKYSRPDAVTWLKDGAISGQHILERKPGAYPSDLDKLIAYMIDGIPAMDGLNPEALGMAGRDQPGILESMRKQASMNILGPLFDAKRRYHKAQGRVLMHYICKYFTDTQLQRIAGQNFNPEIAALIKQQDVQTYDVIVDDAPNSPNKREYIMSVLAEVNRQAPQVAPATALLMIRNLPLDPKEVAEIEQNVKQQLDPMNSPQVQQMMQKGQQEIQKLQQENIKLKTDQTTKMAQVQVDAQVSQQELAQDRQKMLMEHSLDREKLEREFMLKMREMMMEVLLEREKIASQERVGMEAARNQPQQTAA